VHRFYETAPLLQRAEVEARLLGRQDDDSIAGLCGLSPAAVHLYHELCFEVRPYLQAEFYIFDKAIGRKAFYGLKLDDQDILLKLAGYGLGALAVDQLLAYWADPPVWLVALEHLDGAALETLQSKLQMQAWLLSLTIPANAATAARLPAIRSVLAQAGVLGTATAAQEIPSVPTFHADLDSLASVASSRTSRTVEIDSATPSGSEATCTREQGGVVIPCTRDSLAVPA
jgi:hypothetical protein